MIKVRISKPYRLALYALVGTAWTSGVLFFVLKTWFMIEGDYGPMKHPWQFPSLQIHGATAFCMMIIFGFLLGTHVSLGWKVRPRRKLGIALCSMPVFLIITAYLLYYIAEDDLRDLIGYAHLAVGFCLPLMLFAHVYAKRRREKQTARGYSHFY